MFDNSIIDYCVFYDYCMSHEYRGGTAEVVQQSIAILVHYSFNQSDGLRATSRNDEVTKQPQHGGKWPIMNMGEMNMGNL